MGQTANASITFVRYSISLAYRQDQNIPSLGALELLEEKLEHIKRRDATKHLRFPHDSGKWRKSVLQGRRTSPFIATEIDGDTRIIKLSQDAIQGGRPKKFLASKLLRTVLSTVNTTESPTALLVRREMQSWRLLQLEPAALREPDKFDSLTPTPRLSADGTHLPATLYFLAQSFQKTNGNNSNNFIYDQIAARVSELLNDVKDISIDRDEKRELLTLEVTDQENTVYPARSLSGGTLRFLALAVLEMDPQSSGLICLEEPENGIHPERIPTILQLLQDIAVDVYNPIGDDNPLRQVIINTHSPTVVQQIPDDSLLVAELREIVNDGQRFKRACFGWLPETWRHEAYPNIPTVAKGKLLSYLDPKYTAKKYEGEKLSKLQKRKRQRLIDRPDMQQLSLSLFGAPW